TSMEGLQPNTMSALINDVDIEGANSESNADRTAELDPNGLEAATVFTWYTGAGPGTTSGSKSSAIQNRILAGGGRSLYFTWPFEAIDSAGIVGSGESGRINVMRKIIEWLRNVPKAANPSPADHQMGVPRNVVLQWGEVPEASCYYVYIGTDPENLTEPGATVATDDPQYDPYKPGDPSEPLLDLETKYYWRVDCENPDSGMSITTGDIWTFTTAGEGPATNPFPADGATGVATDVTLSWDGTGATYDIYFGQGSLPPSPTATGLTDTEYTPAAPLTLGATYYWRVDSHMVDSTIITGATWTFTVALAGQATDPNPADLATNVPQDVTLSWTGAGVTYDIYLGQGGLPGVATAEGLTSTSYAPPADLTAGATYYWRVDTHMADTPVVPGATWTFTVIIPGAKATNPSPPDLATNVPVDAILSWTGAGVTYDIYLGRGGLPGSATATGLTSAQYTPAGTLSTGATYYWRVDSHLADLSLITGDTWTFTVIGGTAPVSGGGGGGGGGGCFIATSALSSAPCAGPASVESNCTGRYLLTPQRLRQVNNIRSLRDDLLLRLRAGRAFSAWYYALGPYAAEAIRRQEPAKAVVRTVLLDPLAKLSEKTRRKEQ
ncbi:MAG: hypothetical protein J7M08_09255, partial [Planctomycetes bacterium]|nr:hypothetical protein [Planctomycetota bacterium]